jgi:hypothetical protein
MLCGKISLIDGIIGLPCGRISLVEDAPVIKFHVEGSHWLMV